MPMPKCCRECPKATPLSEGSSAAVCALLPDVYVNLDYKQFGEPARSSACPLRGAIEHIKDAADAFRKEKEEAPEDMRECWVKIQEIAKELECCYHPDEALLIAISIQFWKDVKAEMGEPVGE